MPPRRPPGQILLDRLDAAAAEAAVAGPSGGRKLRERPLSKVPCNGLCCQISSPPSPKKPVRRNAKTSLVGTENSVAQRGYKKKKPLPGGKITQAKRALKITEEPPGSNRSTRGQRLTGDWRLEAKRRHQQWRSAYFRHFVERKESFLKNLNLFSGTDNTNLIPQTQRKNSAPDPIPKPNLKITSPESESDSESWESTRSYKQTRTNRGGTCYTLHPPIINSSYRYLLEPNKNRSRTFEGKVCRIRLAGTKKWTAAAQKRYAKAAAKGEIPLWSYDEFYNSYLLPETIAASCKRSEDIWSAHSRRLILKKEPQHLGLPNDTKENSVLEAWNIRKQHAIRKKLFAKQQLQAAYEAALAAAERAKVPQEYYAMADAPESVTPKAALQIESSPREQRVMLAASRSEINAEINTETDILPIFIHTPKTGKIKLEEKDSEAAENKMNDTPSVEVGRSMKILKGPNEKILQCHEHEETEINEAPTKIARYQLFYKAGGSIDLNVKRMIQQGVQIKDHKKNDYSSVTVVDAKKID